MTPLAEHRIYLQDSVRYQAYARALSEVGPDAVVLDLGAGTALLGLTALRLGARRVYGVESTGLADWTRAIVTANGFGDRYVTLQKSSRDVDLPEKVDVIVSDQLGGFVVEGQPFVALPDAAERHLKPGGAVLPQAVGFWLAPVQSALVEEELWFWSERRFGLDVSPLRQVAAGKPLWEKSPPDSLLGPPGGGLPLDTSEPRKSIRLSATLEIDRPGRLNAIAGFFVAQLVPGVRFTTDPRSPQRIDRENILLPLDPALEVASGDSVHVDIRAQLKSHVMTWSATLPDGSRQQHSTFSSYTRTAFAHD